MSKNLPKGSTKLLNAWAFYDWANSVYSLVIASAIFPIFYGALTIVKDDQGSIINDTVNFLGFDFNNDTLISYVTAAAFLVVSAPSFSDCFSVLRSVKPSDTASQTSCMMISIDFEASSLEGIK